MNKTIEKIKINSNKINNKLIIEKEALDNLKESINHLFIHSMYILVVTYLLYMSNMT